MNSIAQRTLQILAEVADTDRVFTEPDLPLFDLGLLDSLGIVTLITRFSEEFNVDISPAEFERRTGQHRLKSWRTWSGGWNPEPAVVASPRGGLIRRHLFTREDAWLVIWRHA